MGIIGIVASIETELTYIKNAMKLEDEVNYSNFKFYFGYYNGLKIVLSSSGIGQVNSSCCTQIMIIKFGVNCIINIGIGMSIRNDVNVCDIVIGHNVEYMYEINSYTKKAFPVYKEFNADEGLTKIAIEAFSSIELKECNYHIGRIISSDNFNLGIEEKKKILKKYDPCCIDVEGAAVAHTCYLSNIPFCVVKGIYMDTENSDIDFYDELYNISAHNASRFIIKMLNIIRIL